MLRRNTLSDCAVLGASVWLIATAVALMLSPIAALGALAFADTLQGGASIVFGWIVVPPAVVAGAVVILTYFE